MEVQYQDGISETIHPEFEKPFLKNLPLDLLWDT